MASILFVDDEASVLDSIRDALHKRSSEWKMGFANSGPEALEMLFKTRYDIVVTDMQMPDMDGITLLSHVQVKYPHMTRFLLTGQADREAIVQMAPVTHQFIYKPCNISDLTALLDRATALHARTQNAFVRRLVNGAKYVPSAPKTAMKIANLLASNTVTLEKVAKLIEEDPGLSVRVLQVVNSAVYGRSKEVTSVSEAISFVGFECAQSLAIANEVFRLTAENKSIGRLIDSVCDKAFRGAGLVAGFLQDHPSCGMAMTAALVRDVGIIISANANPRVYKFVAENQASSDSLGDVERACLGATHAEIGGHLLTLWGIPLSIAEAVTYHHSIHEATVDSIVMAAIHVADIIVENPNASKEAISHQIDWLYIDVNDLRETVDEWLEMDFQALKIA